MSEPKLISPLLDNFLIGEPMSDHNGIRCCPAMNSETNEKYIVKIISLPPSSTQLEALMLTGAIKDEEDAKNYYAERAKDWVREIEALQNLSRQEGFIGCEGFQVVPAEDGIGCEIYILTPYKRTLARQLKKKPFTQLDALNLSIDICSALAACRRGGYLFTNLKPSNIFITENGEFKIGDLGFLNLQGLQYAAIAEHCLSEYTAPEITDAFSCVNDSLDVYALGMVLYDIFNGGELPQDRSVPLPAPKYADAEIAQSILKACDPNPEERWEDPAQMGQMFISYMQKNGAFDVPIVPPAPEPEQEPEPEIADNAEDSAQTSSDEETGDEQIIAAVTDVPEIQDNEVAEEISAEEVLSEEEDVPDEVFHEEPPVEAESCTTELEASEETDELTEPAAEEIPVAAEPIIDELDIPTEAAPSEEAAVVEEISFVTDPAEDEPSEYAEPEQLQIEDILENHDAFSQEAAELKAAVSYLDLDNAVEVPEDISYHDISEEVSQILSQADALAAIEVPEPVVAPEAIEIVIPEAEDNTDADDTQDIDDETDTLEEEIDMSANTEEKAMRRPHWVRHSIIIAILLLLIAGGFLFFKYYVAEPITGLELTGNKDCLTVQVDSPADEKLLSVTCEDKYGITITAPVHQGIAEFTGLQPELTYTVRVNISGLHILTGKRTDTYTTPDETELLQYNVITGNEIGTVVLNFTMDGPTSENWTFTYATDGYEEQRKTFSGTSLTISDLLPQKLYTGVLVPEADLFITKPIEVTFSATELVQANDLKITGCANGKLTVEWKAPETVDVESWSVRCYSGQDGATYDQTYTTSMTSYEFRDLNSAEGFTVEVTAVGQTIVQKTSIGANSVTVNNLTIDEYNNGTAVLSWDSETVPEKGWIVSYTVDNAPSVVTTEVSENTAVISGMIPNAEYSFTVQSGDAVHTFCDAVSCTTAAMDDFSISVNNKKIVADDFDFFMFRHPDKENWIRYDITDAHYTNIFTLDNEAGFVAFLDKKFEKSNTEFYTTIVIRNDKGEIVGIASHTGTWTSVWIDNYYVFTFPMMPDEPGFYTVSVYFNGQFVEEQPFTIE